MPTGRWSCVYATPISTECRQPKVGKDKCKSNLTGKTNQPNNKGDGYTKSYPEPSKNGRIKDQQKTKTMTMWWSDT